MDLGDIEVVVVVASCLDDRAVHEVVVVLDGTRCVVDAVHC